MPVSWNQLKNAFRTLRRSPGFAVGVVLILALGIAANTVMFSLVEGVLLRPLPYRDSDRLHLVAEEILQVRDEYPSVPVTANHFTTWRESARSFDGLAAMEPLTFNLTGDGEPERVAGARVSWNFFELLGVRPLLGRAFLEEEDRPGGDRVAIISESLWKRRFGADPQTLSGTIQVNGVPFTIVGVLPDDFAFAREEQLHSLVRFGERVDLWKPMGFTAEETSEQDNWNYGVVARLAPGATAETARAELDASLAELAKEFPEPIEIRSQVTPLRDALVRGSRRGLIVLLAAVGVVLLVACVNVANLLLVRATARRRQTAIRMALGVGRAGLIRESLAESLLLAAVGGVLGMALAAAGMRLVVGWAPAALPRIGEVGLHWGVLAFATIVSLTTGIVFGIAPAWQLSRTDPQEALRQGGRGATEGAGGGRIRSGLVMAEVALSAVLLVCGGLLLRSYLEVSRIEKGFETERVLAVDLSLPESGYGEEHQRNAFFKGVLARVEALPGVVSAGYVSTLPLSGESNVSPASAENTAEPMLQRPITNFRRVSSDYFRSLGIAVIAGGTFRDEADAPLTVLVSRSLADRLWPGENPLGKRLRRGDEENPLMEVVGVVDDIRALALELEPGFMAYTPLWQDPDLSVSLVLRTALRPEQIASAVRRAIHDVDPNVPVPRLRTMGEVLAASIAERRFQMQLVGGFAVSALLLASLGIFGVVSYAVAQRRQEIGIRMALGATPRHVGSDVVLRGMQPVAVGAAAGLLVSLAVVRVIQSLLFGVRPLDPLTLAAVALLLVVVSVVASAAPALKAARVAPGVTLRAE